MERKKENNKEKEKKLSFFNLIEQKNLVFRKAGQEEDGE